MEPIYYPLEQLWPAEGAENTWYQSNQNGHWHYWSQQLSMYVSIDTAERPTSLPPVL